MLKDRKISYTFLKNNSSYTSIFIQLLIKFQADYKISKLRVCVTVKKNVTITHNYLVGFSKFYFIYSSKKQTVK